MPEGGGGEVVAAEDEGWAMSGGAFVLHAALGDLGGVGESDVFGEVEGPVYEGGVEVVDVAVVAEAGGAGLLVGGGLAEGDVAGLPVFGDLAGVDLVGQVAVDDPVGPDGGAERAHGGVDAGDSGDEEVGVGEVEAGVEAEGHDGGGGASGADAGEEAEDAGFGVEAEVVVALWEGQDGVEVLALDPVLVLAGDVAGVGALLEHVDDDDFDLDGVLRGLRGGLAGGAEGCREQEESEESAHV